MKTKPRVITRCVANHYASSNERIIEFSHNGKGGLISFFANDDGTLSVCVYRCDKGIKVAKSHPSKPRPLGGGA